MSEIKDGAMTKEEAMRIIESAARGVATKQQGDMASEWLRINGAGDVFTKYVLEIEFTEKPKTEAPKIKLPKNRNG